MREAGLRLRVVIITWEYPPRIVGEIARRVEKVASALTDDGIDVSVVTFHDKIQGFERQSNGFEIYRVGNPVDPHLNILTWDLTLATEFERMVSDIYYSTQGKIDVIDAHEWLSIVPAAILKKAFGIPFIYSLYSLEEQRSHHADAPLNTAIRNLEHLGVCEASKILVESEWMKSEVERLHGISGDRIVPISPASPTWAAELRKFYREDAER